MSLQNGSLQNVQSSAKHLDSLYIKTANYKLSNQYNSMYYLYKDSTEKLNKEKELAQVEAADEQQRLEKEEKKKEEEEIRSHNIQYMGITIGIATFFLVLVLMGIFKVSENTIKILGFFAFIMFFEFIILIADDKIHHLTHGEPWKVLAIKIILIAMLLPLHHWLEEKVIHYLTSHNRLTAAGHHIRKVLSRKKVNN
jgi:cation transport ATPase